MIFDIYSTSWRLRFYVPVSSSYSGRLEIGVLPFGMSRGVDISSKGYRPQTWVKGEIVKINSSLVLTLVSLTLVRG